MPKISITDAYFGRLTKDQLKDFMTFVMFSNVAGLQYDSALFKSLLFKLELPPMEVTVTDDAPQEGGQAEVKQPEEGEKDEGKESKE